jgi:hypothetical protein
MEKLIIALTIFISACSIVPKHKSGYVVTDQGRIDLKGGHVVVNMHELHFLDKQGDFTLLKREIKELKLEY